MRGRKGGTGTKLRHSHPGTKCVPTWSSRKRPRPHPTGLRAPSPPRAAPHGPARPSFPPPQPRASTWPSHFFRCAIQKHAVCAAIPTNYVTRDTAPGLNKRRCVCVRACGAPPRPRGSAPGREGRRPGLRPGLFAQRNRREAARPRPAPRTPRPGPGPVRPGRPAPPPRGAPAPRR